MKSNIQKVHLHFKGSSFQGDLAFTPKIVGAWIERHFVYHGPFPDTDRVFDLFISMDATPGEEKMTFMLRNPGADNVMALRSGAFKKASAPQILFALDLPEIFGPLNWRLYQKTRLAAFDGNNSEDDSGVDFLPMHEDFAAKLGRELEGKGIEDVLKQDMKKSITQSYLLTIFMKYKDCWIEENKYTLYQEIVPEKPRFTVVGNS